ncbi:MAG: PhzF family phenazine biosynthesis protein [Dermatophilaceae bacterium]
MSISEPGLAYHHVDVFADRPLRGNGLIVVTGGEPLTTALMQEITREMRQFESIFLRDVDLVDRQATARIFTLDEELSFAGHPVLGAAAVLHGLAGNEPSATWQIRVADRVLTVRATLEGGRLAAEMNQGTGTLGPPLSQRQAADYLADLNLRPEDAHPDLPLQVVDTGLPYLIVPLQIGLDRARITGSDFEARLAECGAKFAYLLDPERPEGRTWDNAGLVEDVATGSAAGPVGLYLRLHGLLPSRQVTLHQGRFVGRPSLIDIRIDSDSEEIWVGGRVAQVGQGHFVPLTLEA